MHDEDVGQARGCPVTPEELELNAKALEDGQAMCPLTGSLQCALTETRDSVIRLEEAVKNQGEDISDLKNEVFGNGKPGLKAEMIKLRMVLTGVKWAAGIFGAAILLDVAMRAIALLAPHAPAAVDAALIVGQ